MNSINTCRRVASRLIWMLAILVLPHFAHAAAPKEETFDELQVGKETYKNVTVTTKSKTYICRLHSTGMANIKVADLSPETREKLGYADFDKPKVSTNAAAVWASHTMAKMDSPEVKEMKQKMQERFQSYFPGGRPTLDSADMKILALAGGILLMLHLCFSYCAMLICQKAGKPGGLLVWLPIVQFLALLRAANMSPAWFLVGFLPFVTSAIIANVPRTPLLMIGYLASVAIMVLLAIIATIIWSFKIAKARGKSAWVGLFFLLPITNFFAFLYLAFSDGEAQNEKPKMKRAQVMTLEIA